MITDKYLIEYLLDYGYEKEDIESEKISITKDDGFFALPIELSKLTNIEELRVFADGGVCLLVNLDDISSGKLDIIDNILNDYDLFTTDSVLMNQSITLSNNKEVKIPDIRKSYSVLNLKDEENKDFLEDVDRLKDFLIDNQYLVTILVPERLTTEQKMVLKEYASEINYGYVTAFIEKDGSEEIYSFSSNEPEYVNFTDFTKADKIFEDIVAGIKEEWCELEKLKYLYDELGERVSYDINVLAGNYEKESRDRANIVARNPFSSILTGKGICTGYAEMYQYVCRKAGLSCDIISNDGHRWNVIEYTNDNGERAKTYCDLTEDAKNIKFRYTCDRFGFGWEFESYDKTEDKSVTTISMKKLKEIDRNIGYNRKTMDYLKLRTDSVKIKGTKERVEFVLDKIGEIQDLANMSNAEVVEKVVDLLSSNKFEFDICIGISSGFIRKDERADKEVRDILWVENDDKSSEDKYLYYTYNSEQKKFKVLEKEVVEELLASGMLELYKGNILPGFESWTPKDNEKNDSIESRNSGFIR